MNFWNFYVTANWQCCVTKEWTTFHRNYTWNFGYFHFSLRWHIFFFWAWHMSCRNVFCKTYCELRSSSIKIFTQIKKIWNFVHKTYGRLSTLLSDDVANLQFQISICRFLTFLFVDQFCSNFRSFPSLGDLCPLKFTNCQGLASL